MANARGTAMQTRGIIVNLISAMIGGIIVGGANYIVSENILTHQSRTEETVAAYADYLAKASEFFVLPSIEKASEVGAAKSRVAIYGSSEVIAALAEFNKWKSTLATEGGCEAFTRIIMTMRTHVWDDDPDDDPDGNLKKNIQVTVYGLDECRKNSG